MGEGGRRGPRMNKGGGEKASFAALRHELALLEAQVPTRSDAAVVASGAGRPAATQPGPAAGVSGQTSKRPAVKPGKGGLPMKKLGSDQTSIMLAAKAAGVSAEVVQLALKSLPYSGLALEGDLKQPVFWNVIEDYFRLLTKEDFGLFETSLRDPHSDSSLKVPPLGKTYWQQWADEERLDEKLVPSISAQSSPVKTKTSKAAAAKQQQERKVSSSFVLSPREDTSELCDVCYGGDSTEGNQIIFCDACNVAVHQMCYGVAKIPEGAWLCESCRVKKSTGKKPACSLCPVRSGALKPVAPTSASAPREWVHLFCSQWIPETFINAADVPRMEPVQNVHKVNKDRFKLLCSICKQKHGACIQCHSKQCAVAFHPMCARAIGLPMEIVGFEGTDDVELRCFCAKHSKRSLDALPGTPLPRKQPQQAQKLSTTASGALGGHSSPVSSSKLGQAAVGSSTPSSSQLTPSKRGKGRSVDMLSECSGEEVRALVKHIMSVLDVTREDILSRVDLEGKKLGAWLDGKASLSVQEHLSMHEWVRKYMETLVPQEKKVGNGSQGTPGKGGKDTSSSPMTLGFKDVKAPAASSAMPTSIPRKFQPGNEDFTHMYTTILLEQFETQRGHAVGGGALGSTSSSTPKVFLEDANEAFARLIACSPDGECMSELFATQNELLNQLAVNRQNLARLFAMMKDVVPGELEQYDKLSKMKREAQNFLNASKEAKRLLKREKKAEQQKEILAAAEAAVANSTRYSGLRKFDEMIRNEEESKAAEEVNIYSKDKDGNDVIYDRFTMERPDQDVLCAVCGSGHSEKPNEIVFCDMCEITVHQNCYGVTKIPDGDWLCWPCKQHETEMLKLGKPMSEIRKPRWQGERDFSALDKITCALCPVKRGAFKKTAKGEWVHVACAMWNPRVQLADIDAAEAVGDIKEALADASQLTCIACKQSGGSTVKCNYGHCQATFHPLCARAAGFFMPIRQGSGANASVRSYCGRHSNAAQQQLTAGDKNGKKVVPPAIQEYIEWLEASFLRLRQTRQELEHLRLITDVVMNRERTKRQVLKADQNYLTMLVDSPRAGLAFEEKLKDPEFVQSTIESGDATPLKRKGFVAPYEAKRRSGKAGQQVIRRETVMTVGEAQATNDRLPAGYMYVPLELSVQGGQ